MNYWKAVSISILSLVFCAVLFGQKKPEITVSPAVVLHHGHVDLKGTGFTPKSNILSHLRRPDGTEHPVLTFYTNDKGEFYHDIDTVVFQPGVHEVWVEDIKTKTTSNVARFEVTMYSKDLK